MPKLSDEQLRPATSRARLTYVKAGPGSGKTFLATERFGYLRHYAHARDHRGVAAVTFARSAARELAMRISHRWGRSCSQWPNQVSTFDELHRTLLRHLVQEGLIPWPSGELPRHPEDSWRGADGVNRRPRDTPWCALGLNAEGDLAILLRTGKRHRPSPVFTDDRKYMATLETGRCTHDEVRSVLHAAADKRSYPRFHAALKEFIQRSYCHLIVDEAFDMNLLDIAIVELAIEAGIGVTVVGDPWQSLYEFRGSEPKSVEQMLRRHKFDSHDMPGSHRYRGNEMPSLARKLFDKQPFTLRSADPSDGTPDVVIACSWQTIWDLTHLPVLPAGPPGRMDGGAISSALVVLLHEVVQRHFRIPATGIGEAMHRLGLDEPPEELTAAYDTLTDTSADDAAVLDAVRNLVPDGIKIKTPGKTVQACAQRLAAVVRSGEPPILGLSVHQAKGLEWPHVQFVHDELQPGLKFTLDRDDPGDREIYVALTRAQSTLTLHTVPRPRWQR